MGWYVSLDLTFALSVCFFFKNIMTHIIIMNPIILQITMAAIMPPAKLVLPVGVMVICT